MILTFALLVVAILFLWCGGDEHASAIRRQLWLGCWLASLIVAVIVGVVTLPGAGIAVGFAGVVYIFREVNRGWLIGLVAAVILAVAVGLMLHRLPGFNNPRVIDAVRFTHDARPFTLYLNYDKTLIGLFIIGWLHRRITRLNDWKTMFATMLPWTAGSIVVLMALSLAMGYVRFAPKLPAQTWLWLGTNLLFVCTAEEALFRGFIQTQLQRLWSAKRGGTQLALVIASVLFGLAHFWGGWAYVALATAAGMCYGWIYLRTQRIEASILAHFALNTVHFFLFTYPALAV